MERQAGDKIDRQGEEKCGVWGRWSGQGGEGAGAVAAQRKSLPWYSKGGKRKKKKIDTPEKEKTPTATGTGKRGERGPPGPLFCSAHSIAYSIGKVNKKIRQILGQNTALDCRKVTN